MYVYLYVGSVCLSVYLYVDMSICATWCAASVEGGEKDGKHHNGGVPVAGERVSLGAFRRDCDQDMRGQLAAVGPLQRGQAERRR